MPAAASRSRRADHRRRSCPAASARWITWAVTSASGVAREPPNRVHLETRPVRSACPPVGQRTHSAVRPRPPLTGNPRSAPSPCQPRPHFAAVPGRMAPCRRAGGAVRTRCRRRRHSPRVAALASASPSPGAPIPLRGRGVAGQGANIPGMYLRRPQMASTAIAVSGQGMLTRTCLDRQDASGKMADNGCAD
jgi:hypothetical protein